MIFETNRLLVRHVTDDDLDAMMAVYGDPVSARYVDDGSPITPDECMEWIKVAKESYATRGYGLSVVTLHDDGTVIGFCGIVHPGGQPEPEIKYAIHHNFWGQGYATEVAQAMIAYGAETFGLDHIIATVHPDNAASHRVLVKAGLTRGDDVTKADGSVTSVFVFEAVARS